MGIMQEVYDSFFATVAALEDALELMRGRE